nr:MAG TPA: hypothetical protein [Caudoviricetes sp.]
MFKHSFLYSFCASQTTRYFAIVKTWKIKK